MQELPKLETRCPDCSGTGRQTDERRDEVICGECNGRGCFLTDAGQSVLRLIDRWRKWSYEPR